MNTKSATDKSKNTLFFYLTSFIYLLGVFVASKFLIDGNSEPDTYIRPISFTTFFAIIFFIAVYFGKNILLYLKNINQDKIISIFFALSVSTMPYNWRFGMYSAIPLLLIAVKNIILGKINKRGLEVWIIPMFVLLEILYLFKGVDNHEGLPLLSRHLYLLGITIISYGINLNKDKLVDIARISLVSLSVFIFINIAYYVFIYHFYTENIFDCLTFSKNYLSYNPDIDASLKFMEWSHSNHHGIDMWIFSSIYIMAYIINRKYKILNTAGLIAFPLLMTVFCFINQSRYGFILLGVIFSFIMLYELNMLFSRKKIVGIFTKLIIVLYTLSMLSSLIFIEKMDFTRYKIYKNSWYIIKEYSFMGAGTGFDNVPKTNIEGLDEVPHSHNLYISSMVDTGILGAALQLFFILYIMYYGYRRKNRIMLAFGIIIYPFTFVDSPTYVMISVPVYFSLLSIAMSIDKKELPL